MTGGNLNLACANRSKHSITNKCEMSDPSWMGFTKFRVRLHVHSFANRQSLFE